MFGRVRLKLLNSGIEFGFKVIGKQAEILKYYDLYLTSNQGQGQFAVIPISTRETRTIMVIKVKLAKSDGRTNIVNHKVGSPIIS